MKTLERHERGIIFQAEMVRAILGGKKTQTRRVVKPQPPNEYSIAICDSHGLCCWSTDGTEGGDCFPGDNPLRCPYGTPGDRLWVRETWAINDVRYEKPIPKERPADLADLIYRADGEMREQFELCDGDLSWRSPRFMPRWASRLTLEIVRVRVERLQEITDDGALAEGVDRTNTSIPGYATERYKRLWDSLNAKRGYAWASNPWVFVIEFRQAIAESEAASDDARPAKIVDS